MENSYQDQLDRIDRLLKIINASDQYVTYPHLQFEDILIFSCQCMWHLKDWVLNDANFGAKDSEELKKDIYKEKSLQICSDLANGFKHLHLKVPKTSLTLSDQTGVHVDPTNKIFQTFYYIVSKDQSDVFHGVEIRALLNECRDVWERIINKHYLSKIDLN